ncbi:ferredoxin [Streptomyces violaceorubidus]
MQQEAGVDGEALEVWIDQDLCTGDGICAQYAPEVFELDIDGLAYVKGADDELLQAPGRQRRCR